MTRPATFPADLPFADGRPLALGPARWAVVLAAVAAGFAALYLPVPDTGGLGGFLPALLFPLLPLLALRAGAGAQAWTLFRPVGRRDLVFACGIVVLNLAVSAAVALLVSRWFGAQDNPVLDRLRGADAGRVALFLLQTVPQLLGEELLTILPLLAVMAGLRRLDVARGPAVVTAWLLSAGVFGLAHLPTYEWHVAQCLLVIGSARLVLTLAYLRTGNLWVSTLAHVINDWLLFALVLGLERAAA